MSEKGQEPDIKKPTVVVIGIILKKTRGGHTRFIEGLLDARIPFRLVHFNTARPPKDRSSSKRPGYGELLDAGIKRALLGAGITIYHALSFPLFLIKEASGKSPTGPVRIAHFVGTTFWPFWEYALYALMLKLARAKTIYHWHASFDDFWTRSPKIGRFFIWLVLRGIDLNLVLSKTDYQAMQKVVRKDRVTILPNGISPEFLGSVSKDKRLILAKQEPTPSPAGETGDRPITFLFMGGRDPIRKGLVDLLRALNLIYPSTDDGATARVGRVLGPEGQIRLERARFVVSGGGNVDLALAEAPPGEKAKGHISYLGYLTPEETVREYLLADVLVLPSYEEGLPYGILEAMGAGQAIVSTPVGGIPDVVEEGKNGFLVSPGDYTSLAQRLLDLVDSPKLLSQIGQNNRRKIEEEYFEPALFDRLGTYYQNLLEKN